MRPSGNLLADTICRPAVIGVTITAAADVGTFTTIDAAPVAVEGHCANDGATLTHRVTGWILQRLAIDRMSVAATAKALGVGWELVNQVAVGCLPTARLR